MADHSSESPTDPVSDRLYDVESSDPRSELVDRSSVAPEDVAQIGRLMQALSALREAELAVSDASQKFMRLSSQDMRALHYLIVAKNQGSIVTPGILAAHLTISAASMTKLLNRLERDGHIDRRIHPTDRRAFSITITAKTEAAAMQTVGRQQAKRFHAAARLSREEREVIIRFLKDMTAELSLDGEAWAEGAHAPAP